MPIEREGKLSMIHVSLQNKKTVDYGAGAESMQLMRARFEERGKAERLKLLELIAFLSKPIMYTILISNER